MEDYEGVLLVKPEVFVYKVPPRATNRGYRAADWNLQTPDWTGRMRLVTKGKDCILKLEDKTTGELFAKCPIDKYPGIAVEAVMDSSRYFVLRIQDDGGRAAFIGFGFGDRGDSFDFNVALQDHFKWLQKTEELEKEEKHPETKPQLDLGFKEGQTITINMKIGQKTIGQSRPKAKGSGAGVLLPPPPSAGGVKIAPPPSASSGLLVSRPNHDVVVAPQLPKSSATSTTTSSSTSADLILISTPSSETQQNGDAAIANDQPLLDLGLL